jgi:hypothetical protein
VISFLDVGLVNTKGIDPQIAHVSFAAALSEKVEQVLPHGKKYSIKEDESRNCFITPHIGERLIRGRVIQGHNLHSQ